MEGVKVIGYITDADKGCAMITRDGESEISLRAQGWNPLADEKTE
jgi:thiamine-monophosphate kinase